MRRVGGVDWEGATLRMIGPVEWAAGAYECGRTRPLACFWLAVVSRVAGFSEMTADVFGRLAVVLPSRSAAQQVGGGHDRRSGSATVGIEARQGSFVNAEEMTSRLYTPHRRMWHDEINVWSGRL